MNLIMKIIKLSSEINSLTRKNIGIDILIKFVGAIVKVLCHFASKVMISEMVRLPRNGSLGAIQ